MMFVTLCVLRGLCERQNPSFTGLLCWGDGKQLMDDGRPLRYDDGRTG
jgi:hypothetical protein